ncbi:hypothetical protein MAR_024313 [Mya arenaria]|uniref:Endonuclease/exonuclease/phosphatase domain-containing protein n=1 Tax=Mya arenaria TaxID=6604 RepID=A0ABY7DUC0_MYAAR|nr:hypothetical protein MAR_024313 [Mya arenaria]
MIDIIIVTEVFPKNIKAMNIDSREYSLKGYQCFSAKVQENSRGVVIYVKETIVADYCDILCEADFSESVWCELRLANAKKLLIGGIYKSPSSNLVNQRNLNLLLSQACSLTFDHLVILGDFNFPEIDWSTWTVHRNETHPAFSFVKCLRDNFLNQHVQGVTRYRQGQDPSCLDLLLTDNQTEVENLTLNRKLGASDHISIICEIPCVVNKDRKPVNEVNFFKGDYVKIKNYLSRVNWKEMADMNVEDSWSFLLRHMDFCVENFIPECNTKGGCKKTKWMDYYCVRKVKKKYHAWKRYTYSRTIRFSKKKYQKSVAESSKTSQKSFWSFVKGETNTRSGIGDLRDKNGNIATEIKDKANILNDFFASVFTREDNSEIPNFEDKLEKENFISDIIVSPQLVLKHLKALNASKACGPDNCHPFFLKQCAEEIYIPLSEIFQKSLQEDIDRLCQWSKNWLLKFNIKKCKIVSFGNEKFYNDYNMIDENGNVHKLARDFSEKDLGVLFTNNLNFETHINNTVNKVNKIIGLIRRKFTFMDKSLFLTLYKSLVRSHLDYGNLIYFPYTKKCKQVLENAQRRATRLIPELRGLSYQE